MDLGSTIYKLRTAKNLSQEDLAERLGVSRQSVSKWENNTATPDLEKLVKLCGVFEISLDELAGRSRPERGEPVVTAAPTKNPALPRRKIAGYILLVCALLFVLGFLNGKLSAYAMWITLAALPTLLFCGLICLSNKEHAGYRCFWVACIFSEYPLWRFGLVLLQLFHRSVYWYQFSVLLWFLIPVPLGIAAASHLLRDVSTPVRPGRGCRLILYWFLLFVAFLGGLNGIYFIPAELVHHWNGTNILHYIFTVLLTAILALLLTATVLHLRSWRDQKKRKP